MTSGVREILFRFFAAAAALMLTLRPVSAEPSIWQLCANQNHAYTFDQQIGGCTSVIETHHENQMNLSVAYENRGIAYLNKKDYENALSDLSEAIRLNPNSAKALNERCWTSGLVSHDLAGALADCNEALRLLPNNPNFLNSRGLVQLKLGTFDRAIADYGSAVAQNPKDAGSLYGRGVAKLKSGNTADGNADITAAKAIRPDIAEVYSGYGVK